MLKNLPFLKLFVLIFLFYSSHLLGQEYYYSVFPGDTIQLSVNIPTGQVTQWQMTNDTSQSWQPIANSTSNTIEIFSEESTTGFLYYRAEISDPNICSSVFYSDIIKHRIINSSSDEQVGDWFVGGLVFYKDNKGGGLVTTINDLGNSQWGCFGTYINGTENGIGKGEANTDSIVYYHDYYLPDYYSNPTQCHPNNDGSVAAKFCDTLVQNGYSDWFLPSKDELDLMYTNLHQNGLGNFNPSPYWSSTDSTGNGAWMQNFSSGTQYYYGGKDYAYLVRAIRYYSFNEKPLVSIDSINNINPVSAKAYATITNNDNIEILERGICWDTQSNPTILSDKGINEEETLSFNETAVLLEATTTYYLRAYLRTANDTIYSEEESFTTTADFPNCGTVTDIDGNEYQTVIIGDQCWMRENLKVTHYPDGTEIPLVEDNIEWGNLGDNDIDDAYCWYENDINNKNIYGALYTYAAATNGDNSGENVQGACPDGWHVASDDEWKSLELHLGMSADEVHLTGSRGTDQGAKLAGNADLWQDGDLENNINFGISGFQALPNGTRINGGEFIYVGRYDNWLTSKEYSSSRRYGRGGNFNTTKISRGTSLKSDGDAVRCIKNQNTPYIPVIMLDSINNINPVSAKAYATITNNDNIEILEKGICWDTQSNPTILSDKGINEEKALSFNETAVLLEASTTYYLKAYLRTSNDTIYSEEESFTTTADFPNCGTVTDIDGNEYQTVIIGDQCWMRENLNTSKYNDGTGITNITNNDVWEATIIGARTYYDNDSLSYASVYGALYNWYVVSSEKNVCPSGWRIPIDEDWNLLIETVGNVDDLKDNTDIFWNDNGKGTNISGYTSLPAGTRGINFDYGSFNNIGSYTSYWSNSGQYNETYAFSRPIEPNGGMYQDIDKKTTGLSLRCIKDECDPLTEANAGMDQMVNDTNVVTLDGNIVSNGYGYWNIVDGDCGYLQDSLINNTIFAGNYGSTYVLTWNIFNDCNEFSIDTVIISFSDGLSFPLYDFDGNGYDTVRLGSQTWMTNNLKVTHLNDGTPIELIEENSEWSNILSPAMCYYANDCSNKQLFGGLYNWYTVNTNKLCPLGWEVPTHADWEILQDYLITNGYNFDGSNSGNKIAKAMAKRETWAESNSNGTPGDNSYPSFINKSGFSSLPSGIRNYTGTFNSLYDRSYWWSKDEWDIETTPIRIIIYQYPYLQTQVFFKEHGASIRCIKTHVKTVQQRLNEGETPYDIFNSGTPLDSLYGKIYQGGLIFYLDTNNGSGMVAASDDFSETHVWGCVFQEINGADGTIIGTGEQNTIDILNDCNQVGSAADVCADLELNSYSDWYLPSIDELKEMYFNLHQNGYGNFVPDYYLSSSELTDVTASTKDFGGGNMEIILKNSSSNVRAIRNF